MVLKLNILIQKIFRCIKEGKMCLEKMWETSFLSSVRMFSTPALENVATVAHACSSSYVKCLIVYVTFIHVLV